MRPISIWRLAVPYWQSKERWRARLLITIVLALTLGLVFLLVQLNEWNRAFYEALQNYDFPSFAPLLLRFCVLATLYIIGAVYKQYFTQMLEMSWRSWLTQRFVADWLDARVYYRLELEPWATDNPDQRIADDVRMFTSDSLDLGLGLVSSLVTLVSFIVILWNLSGTLTLGSVELPGYMVWAALVYALGGSMLARVIGRPLIGLNFTLQRYEADFRFNLVRVRENAEGIAMYRGEDVESNGLLTHFAYIRDTWWELMRAAKRLTFLVVGYNQTAVVFPLFVAAPRYFSGAISLGVLMQISNAFGQVQGALSWFVDSYASLARWKASTDRLLTFQQRIQSAAAAAEHPTLSVLADDPHGLSTRKLELRLPNGELLLANGNFDFESGQWVMVSGPNGSGKSTLFRAIAGIWPFGCGVIHVPAGASLMFLPQRPYIPIGSLREAVSYPSAADAFTDLDRRDALCAVGLGRFLDRLDEQQSCGAHLSGGEQQRLALARAVLHRPEWLFLDEATSAVDETGERELYDLLRERLPKSTILTIAHRAQLARYHTVRLVLTDGSAYVREQLPDGRPMMP